MQWWAYALVALTVVSVGITGFAAWWSMRLNRSRLQLAQSLRAVMRGSTDAIVLEDANGCITHWSTGAQARLGYSAEEMLGQTRQRLIPADEIQQDDVRGVNLRVSKSGSAIPVTTTYTPILDDRGQRVGLCCVMREAPAQAAADELIRALSFNDALTGLPNWRPCGKKTRSRGSWATSSSSFWKTWGRRRRTHAITPTPWPTRCWT
jgi:PAS domain S-box-containing protein